MKIKCFPEIKKNFGFGFMRLPMIDDKVDIEQTKKMVDLFIDAGFNYFDTAHGYIGGKSELAIKECLSSRYKRDKYILANKLSTNFFEKEEDIIPFFESQLLACGVDYFDFYLMHAQNRKIYEKYKSCHAYEKAIELKETGKIKHLGISFHDTADVLDKILSEKPEVEFVQIQLNYADYNDPSVQSRLCLEVCMKHRKPVIVMEPVKGGSLTKLPPLAKQTFDKLGNTSYASYAIRFAAGAEGVFMVLSGMSSIDMVKDNISYMKDFKPLSEKELAAIEKVNAILKAEGTIGCTACKYCTEVCPKGIAIPEFFACLNAKKIFNDWSSEYYYEDIHAANSPKASDCIKCGRCEEACPQKLNIRALLEDVAVAFEK